jgi:hypothetical protein
MTAVGVSQRLTSKKHKHQPNTASPAAPIGWEVVRHDQWKGTTMDELTKTIATRGDLAHLALFLWASGASAVLVWTLHELAAAN